MRALVAGLFVYIGLMASVFFISEWNLFETQSLYILVPLIVMVLFLLFYSATLLFNKRTIIQDTYDADDQISDIDRNWNFKYMISAEMLLKADLEERNKISGMSKFFQGALIFLGLVWVCLPIINTHNMESLWQSVISELLGLFVLYNLAIKPFFIRRKIKVDFSQPEENEMSIGLYGFQIFVNGYRFDRCWDELIGVLNTSSGIMFYWVDDTKNWLPESAFDSSQEYQEFSQFVIKKCEIVEAEL